MEAQATQHLRRQLDFWKSALKDIDEMELNVLNDLTKVKERALEQIRNIHREIQKRPGLALTPESRTECKSGNDLNACRGSGHTANKLQRMYLCKACKRAKGKRRLRPKVLKSASDTSTKSFQLTPDAEQEVKDRLDRKRKLSGSEAEAKKRRKSLSASDLQPLAPKSRASRNSLCSLRRKPTPSAPSEVSSTVLDLFRLKKEDVGGRGLEETPDKGVAKLKEASSEKCVPLFAGEWSEEPLFHPPKDRPFESDFAKQGTGFKKFWNNVEKYASWILGLDESDDEY